MGTKTAEPVRMHDLSDYAKAYDVAEDFGILSHSRVERGDTEVAAVVQLIFERLVGDQIMSGVRKKSSDRDWNRFIAHNLELFKVSSGAKAKILKSKKFRDALLPLAQQEAEKRQR